jgi:hypothetical protein
MGLTNLEQIVQSIFKIFTTRAFNGRISTGADYVALAADVPARIVYISNTTGEVLYVRMDTKDLYLPDGAIFPFNNISNLNTISVKTASSTASLTVTYRYEL